MYSNHELFRTLHVFYALMLSSDSLGEHQVRFLKASQDSPITSLEDVEVVNLLWWNPYHLKEKRTRYPASVALRTYIFWVCIVSTYSSSTESLIRKRISQSHGFLQRTIRQPPLNQILWKSCASTVFKLLQNNCCWTPGQAMLSLLTISYAL